MDGCTASGIHESLSSIPISEWVVGPVRDLHPKKAKLHKPLQLSTGPGWIKKEERLPGQSREYEHCLKRGKCLIFRWVLPKVVSDTQEGIQTTQSQDFQRVHRQGGPFPEVSHDGEAEVIDQGPLL